MAEYYPLLAKAVGSLPNSTPQTRRIVYERARKALIGQLRTLHPPVPDDDIERESVALDRAVERLEAELATGITPPPPAAAPTPAPAAPAVAAPASDAATKPSSVLPAAGDGAIGPAAKRPLPPLRTKPAKTEPVKKSAPTVPVPSSPPHSAPPVAAPPAPPPPETTAEAVPLPPTEEPASPEPIDVTPSAPSTDVKRAKPPRGEPQRPIAPQPLKTDGPKRRLWIIPVGVGVVVILVALAAWKLRDRPETIARNKPAEQSQTDTGKIADRVGGGEAAPAAMDTGKNPQPQQQADTTTPPATDTTSQPATSAPANPEVPVAHRAALLVEAPDEPNKVKTFLGTVVWKLDNQPQGQTDTVGLAVEADIDLPDDKMKAVVTFEKNTDSSLPASHTIKVRFMVEPGSFSGDVKQISVPQMRPEASPSGEALAGVTVPVVQDSFLVGLSPGNAESANLDLMRRLQWIDIPMLLDSGKIAKLTFEKSDSGQRDLNEAFEAWQKQ